MSQPVIRYAFDQAPAVGDATEIFPGLLWARLGLPMALDHINVWISRSDQQSVIIDTGINTRTSKETWQTLFSKYVAPRTLAKVVATHLHPDHVGLAGWLTREHDCELYMTRSEYLLCRTLCFDSSLEIPEEALAFYRAAGITEEQLKLYSSMYGGFGRAVTPLPQSYRRLQEGDTLDLCDETWTILVGNGHSPEHACLFNAERNVLISGDQILPRISSIIAVWPTEPEADPLGDWLQSCRRFAHDVAADTLVLPSHGLPFYGAPARLRQLIDHHESSLEQLFARCSTPQRAIDVFDVLFHSAIDDSNRVMAVGETMAHFNHLRHQGRIERERIDGVDWYHSR
ncbi:MAG: MBL fold metallo-hydrolase [Pseudomonadota bacterium]